jgi:hypothetical protein
MQLLANAALLLPILLDDNLDIQISVVTVPGGIRAFLWR